MLANRRYQLGDVWQEMNRLQGEMNRMFGRWGSDGARSYARTAYPPLNAWEDDNSLYVEAELPGFEMSDVEIYVTGENQLSLKGERKQPEMQGGTWHRQERGFGSFARLVELPNAVDSNKVAASFQHGVLTVTLPKQEAVKPRRIEVKGH